VEHYSNARLNSAVGYVTPKEMLAGRQQEIHTERDRKLETARKQRRGRRLSEAVLPPAGSGMGSSQADLPVLN
jgi:hypothetical protein